MTRPGMAQTKKGARQPQCGADLPAGQIAEGRANGNGHIKDGEDAVAFALGIEVGQHGGGEDAEGGLADADQGLADVEGPVAVNPDGGQRGQAPENRAGDDERLAREAVAEPAGERRGEHVEDEQRGGERAHLLVGGVELALDEREFAGKDVAVDVVEQVEGDEQQERAAGTMRGVDRRERRKDFACGAIRRSCMTDGGYSLGRGQRASTVVPMPPRGRNSPRTTAQTGSQALTTSSSTWLTMFSWKMPRLR